MFYYGTRSSLKYLERLRGLSNLVYPHHFISMIGGCEFLNAIGPNTKRLTLVDPNLDSHLHCKLILRLISISEGIKDFLSFLSGRVINDNWKDGNPFGANRGREIRSILRAELHDPDLEFLYETSYGSILFDLDDRVAFIDDSMILFFGFDLTPMTFCWHFGEGYLKSEESFSALKKNLSNLDVSYTGLHLKDLNYHELEAAEPLIILAANAESPLFTKGDTIVAAINDSAQSRIQYLSWHRHFTIIPNTCSAEYVLEFITSNLKSAADWYVLGNLEAELNFSQTCFVNTIRVPTLEELSRLKPYGATGLLVMGLNFDKDTFLESTSPLFKKVLFINSSSLAENISFYQANNVSRTYILVHLEQMGAQNIMLWELRGGSDS